MDAVLGGTFYVTDIRWEGGDVAVVDYEDGHIAETIRARVRVTAEGGMEVLDVVRV